MASSSVPKATSTSPQKSRELGVLNNYGWVSLHEQSHGESFLSLVLNRFWGDGIYLLDEPESALSPSRQMSFIVAMHDLVKKGSQFIIATHSAILMAFPGATIYQFTDASIQAVPYRETEHYKVTRAFLARTDQMLAELTGEIQSPTQDERQSPPAHGSTSLTAVLAVGVLSATGGR